MHHLKIQYSMIIFVNIVYISSDSNISLSQRTKNYSLQHIDIDNDTISFLYQEQTVITVCTQVIHMRAHVHNMQYETMITLAYRLSFIAILFWYPLFMLKAYTCIKIFSLLVMLVEFFIANNASSSSLFLCNLIG